MTRTELARELFYILEPGERGNEKCSFRINNEYLYDEEIMEMAAYVERLLLEERIDEHKMCCDIRDDGCMRYLQLEAKLSRMGEA